MRWGSLAWGRPAGRPYGCATHTSDEHSDSSLEKPLETKLVASEVFVILWRRVLFIVVILGAQGTLGVVLPVFISPPDLFLLTALALTSRLTPLWTLAVGYSLGLLQDILGAGALGFHAAGIMAGVLAAGFVRRGLSSDSSFNQAFGVVTALLTKWLVFIALGYWMRLDAMNLETLLYRFTPEVIVTLLLAPLFELFFNWAFGKSRSSEDRLF